MLALADVFLAVVHITSRDRQIARERVVSPLLSMAGDGFPLVCVQLPVFNEASLVEPAIDAMCALNWPRDRLEIMILDDSTDETSSIGDPGRVAHWHARGFAIKSIARQNRDEFKAGALAAGMKLTAARYLAIFDADYRPPRTFLHDVMSVLLDDPRLAFVQARFDYRNRDHNALTRAQAMDLDTLLVYEQAARSWAGIPMTFNGTCGVWRRQAIEEAGGWSGTSLAEDQDLSFRAYALGWRSRYLVSVSAEGELPEHFDVLVTQRQRWSAGTAQTFRALPWKILRQLRLPQAFFFSALTLFLRHRFSRALWPRWPYWRSDAG